MRKMLIMLLAIILTLSLNCSVFATSFSDVPPNHWAYTSVQKLIKAGVVEGYDAKTFDGEKPITRYEMAVIVGKAMDNYSKADDANKTEILKLITEFSKELDTLGVKVSNLEKKSKFDLTGDWQFRYSIKPNDKDVISGVGADYRFRINGLYDVTDQTAINFRIASEPKKGGQFFAYAPTTFTSFGQNGSQNGTIGTANNANTVSSIALDQAYITQKIGKVKASLGELPLKFDNLNVIVNSSAYSFDGLKLTGATGSVNWTANWGRFESNVDVANLDAVMKTGKLTYNGGYAKMWDSKTSDWAMLQKTAFTDGNITRKYTDLYQNNVFGEYIYGTAKYDFDSKWLVSGLLLHNNAATVAAGSKNAFYVQTQYGDKTLTHAGDNNIQLTYYGSGLYGFNRFLNPDYPNSLGKLAMTDAVLDVMAFRSINLTYNYAINPTLSTYLTYEKIDDKSHSVSGYGFTLYRLGMVAKF